MVTLFINLTETTNKVNWLFLLSYDGNPHFSQTTINQPITYGGAFIGQRGKRPDHGMLAYPDGSVLTGTWVSDLPHGEGTLFHQDGRVETVHYKQGILT